MVKLGWIFSVWLGCLSLLQLVEWLEGLSAAALLAILGFTMSRDGLSSVYCVDDCSLHVDVSLLLLRESSSFFSMIFVKSSR